MKDLHRRVPVDVTAARVVQPGPKHLDLKLKDPVEVLSPTPLLLRAIAPFLSAPSFLDLTGRVVGWLTVIGLALQPRRNGTRDNKLQWVCRCACGYYTLRSSRALKNHLNVEDSCQRCVAVRRLRSRDVFRQTGTYPDP